ncbi:hypothetical protein SF83666_a44100 (plasmid) [Sinorhizobium fredii CCBAU 83666]|nr:hypothetical protein SF83666_a44100 [Sinorhizobium fredii CCBAU 83666]
MPSGGGQAGFTPKLAATLSPHTGHIRRLGKYALNMDDQPAPLVPK